MATYDYVQAQFLDRLFPLYAAGWGTEKKGVHVVGPWVQYLNNTRAASVQRVGFKTLGVLVT